MSIQEEYDFVIVGEELQGLYLQIDSPKIQQPPYLCLKQARIVSVILVSRFLACLLHYTTTRSLIGCSDQFLRYTPLDEDLENSDS